MILLMNENYSKANSDSFSATVATSVLNTVVGQKKNILKKVKKPDLHAAMTSALNRPLGSHANKRPGKFHRVEKLVEIWLIFKKVDSLLGKMGTRSNIFNTFIDIMTRYEGLASEAVQASTNKFKAWKSEPMPAGEKERGFLEDGGLSLNAEQYPRCPNSKCKHKFIDQPPGNATATAKNKEILASYMQLCNEFKTWKQSKGPQPICPEKNESLTKMPAAPKTIKRYMRCHCAQTYSDPRSGKQCPCKCVYNGVSFPIGKCPICLCVCSAFIHLDQYTTIMTVTLLDTEEEPNQRSRSTGMAR